ncbi:hypothetical protein ACHAXM_002285 [Skeletonema potamos]
MEELTIPHLGRKNKTLKRSPPSSNMHYRNKSTDTANEEWSEILAVTTGASITTPLQMRLAPADPTPVEVDVNKGLSAQDLQALKKQDPFLYYSIPGVRNAAVRFNADADNMHQLAQDGLRRNCASCPASMQGTATNEESAKVKRCTRVSFECHTDLLLEDLMEDEDIDMDLEKRLNNLRLGRLDDVLADLFR